MWLSHATTREFRYTAELHGDGKQMGRLMSRSSVMRATVTPPAPITASLPLLQRNSELAADVGRSERSKELLHCQSVSAGVLMA